MTTDILNNKAESIISPGGMGSFRPSTGKPVQGGGGAAARVLDWAAAEPARGFADARLASWWLTLKDLHWPDFEQEEEIVRRAKFFADHGVNAVVIFGFHFRWDFVPYFQRINALLKRIVQECHRHGIRVFDHYSDTLTHRPATEEDRWYIRTRLNHHVPLYPDADQDFQYAGSFRNTWRMVDARTGEAVFFPPYRCNLYCPNNPDYQRASTTYARQLFTEVGIDGLMDDDFHFHPGYFVCACGHCRGRYAREYGRELPPATETDFWGNTNNPAFRQWLEMRLNSMGDHFVRMRRAIGPDKLLFTCCSETASRWVSDIAAVYDQFVRGCNVVCIEMVNNAPLRSWQRLFANQMPYHAIAQGGAYFRRQVDHVLKTPAADPIVGLGYAESPNQFFMCWALQKAWGARSWVCRRTAAHTPEEARRIPSYDDQTHLGSTLRWEKEHAELFEPGAPVCDVAVVFSPSTRSFGSVEQANRHEKAYLAWLERLCRRQHLCDSIVQQALAGAEAGVELRRRYGWLVLPGVAALDEGEMEGLRAYVRAGGRLLVGGELGTITVQGEQRDGALAQGLKSEPKPRGGRVVWMEEAAPGQTIPPFQRSVEADSSAAEWHFQLYRRENELLLHLVNMSGVPLLAEGEPEEALKFPLPESGRVSVRLDREKLGGDFARARLFSPDLEAPADLEISDEGQWIVMSIPVQRTPRYAIVRIELANDAIFKTDRS